MEAPESLATRFVDENVTPYITAPGPIDPAFINDVAWLLAGWPIGKGLDLAYAELKKRLGSRKHLRRLQTRGTRVIPIFGSGPDRTVFNIGKVRPFFRVGRGNLVILRDISILYEGPPDRFFEVEKLPGVLLLNVRFAEAGSSEGKLLKDSADFAAKDPAGWLALAAARGRKAGGAIRTIVRDGRWMIPCDWELQGCDFASPSGLAMKEHVKKTHLPDRNGRPVTIQTPDGPKTFNPRDWWA